MKRFDEMHKAYKKGLISKEDWDTYCAYCLDKLIQANKDVLIRLKEV